MVRLSMANFEYQIRSSLADLGLRNSETVFRNAWVRGSNPLCAPISLGSRRHFGLGAIHDRIQRRLDSKQPPTAEDTARILGS